MQFFPRKAFNGATYKVQWSHPNDVMLDVYIFGKPAVALAGVLRRVEARRARERNKRWLVSYVVPNGGAQNVPALSPDGGLAARIVRVGEGFSLFAEAPTAHADDRCRRAASSAASRSRWCTGRTRRTSTIAKTRPGKPTVVENPVHADFRVAKHEGALQRRGRVRQHGGAPAPRRGRRTTSRRRRSSSGYTRHGLGDAGHPRPAVPARFGALQGDGLVHGLRCGSRSRSTRTASTRAFRPRSST